MYSKISTMVRVPRFHFFLALPSPPHPPYAQQRRNACLVLEVFKIEKIEEKKTEKKFTPVPAIIDDTDRALRLDVIKKNTFSIRYLCKYVKRNAIEYSIFDNI